MVISGLTRKNTKATLKCCYAHIAMWWLSSAMINYLHNSIHPPEMEINPPEMAHRWWGYKTTLTYNLLTQWNASVNLQLHILGDPQSVQLVNTTAKTLQKQHCTFRVHWTKKQNYLQVSLAKKATLYLQSHSSSLHHKCCTRSQLSVPAEHHTFQ